MRVFRRRGCQHLVAAEEDLELLFVTPAELKELIVGGEFRLSVHVAMVALAALAGRLWL